MDKRDLFFANKKRIEQVWKLLEVSMELLNDIVDTTDSSFSNSYEVYEILSKANGDLYETYDDNITKFSENKTLT